MTQTLEIMVKGQIMAHLLRIQWIQSSRGRCRRFRQGRGGTKTQYQLFGRFGDMDLRHYHHFDQKLFGFRSNFNLKRNNDYTDFSSVTKAMVATASLSSYSVDT